MALGDVDLAPFHHPGPDLRALGVERDGEEDPVLLLEGAGDEELLPLLLVRPVAEVQPHDVHALLVELEDHLRGLADAEHRDVLVAREGEGLVDVVVDELVVDEADAAPGLPLDEALDGVLAHPRGEHPVEAARGAAPLDVAEDGRPRVEAGRLLDVAGEGMDVAVELLRDDEDRALVAVLLPHRAKGLDDLLLGDRVVGGEDHLRALGDAGEEGEVAAAVAHDLDDGAAGMAFGGVPDLVDALDDRVERGVEADRVVGGSDVVIDGAGKADAVDAHLRELLRAHVGAVAPDDDEALDAALVEDFHGLSADRLLLELREAGGAEDRAPAVDDVGHRLPFEPLDPPLDEAAVAVVDAVHLEPVGKARPHHGADGAVHAGRVAARGQDADSLDHEETSSSLWVGL